jgi:predicted 3-demethylubiquinone-9 3-methyltransferase (glyoxalase superfamily)
MPTRINPFLWFDTEAEEAAEYYVSLFPNSRIVNVSHYTDAGPRPAGMAMTVEFELDGERFYALNGGPQHHFNEAISFFVTCDTQDEVDAYWERLSDGGEEIACGWVKDRYGLFWQVVPDGMIEMFQDSDRDRASRAMAAMMTMRKLDLPAIRAAADGVSVG